MREKLHGVIPALVTPFVADGSAVDFISLRKLIEHVQAGGVSCVVSCGSTGEAVALTDREYSAVIKATRESLQGTLIAGCGASSTARTIELGTLARDAGAQALLVVNPPYTKPTAAGLVAHYRAVAKATRLPLIAYNVPGRTGMNIPVHVIVELAKDGDIIGLKDSSGVADYVSEIAAGAPSDFTVLAGDDSVLLPYMSIGARGVVSVAANVVPAKVIRIFAAVEKGDWAEARRAHLELFPLAKAIFNETNPIPIKALAQQLGIISHDTLRLPLLSAGADTRRKLMDALG